MENFYTLERYNATERGYHVHKANSTSADGQMHYHKHYQVGFVLAGKVEHRQNRKYVTLRAGDAFVVPPGYPHSLHFLGENTLLYSLCFDDHLIRWDTLSAGMQQFLQGLLNETYYRRVLLRIRPDERQAAGLVALLDALSAEQAAEHFPELSSAPGMIHSILCLLAQAYYTMPFTAVLLADMKGYNDSIRRCIYHVDVHFRKKLSSESLAKRFGISRAALCAAFPQYTGMPLHKYIIRKRILEAQLQMRTRPGVSIAKIAQELGYTDDSTFYRNFLQVTGMTPSQFRKQCAREQSE